MVGSFGVFNRSLVKSRLGKYSIKPNKNANNLRRNRNNNRGVLFNLAEIKERVENFGYIIMSNSKVIFSPIKKKDNKLS